MPAPEITLHLDDKSSYKAYASIGNYDLDKMYFELPDLSKNETEYKVVVVLRDDFPGGTSTSTRLSEYVKHSNWQNPISSQLAKARDYDNNEKILTFTTTSLELTWEFIDYTLTLQPTPTGKKSVLLIMAFILAKGDKELFNDLYSLLNRNIDAACIEIAHLLKAQNCYRMAYDFLRQVKDPQAKMEAGRLIPLLQPFAERKSVIDSILVYSKREITIPVLLDYITEEISSEETDSVKMKRLWMETDYIYSKGVENIYYQLGCYFQELKLINYAYQAFMKVPSSNELYSNSQDEARKIQEQQSESVHKATLDPRETMILNLVKDVFVPQDKKNLRNLFFSEKSEKTGNRWGLKELSIRKAPSSYYPGKEEIKLFFDNGNNLLALYRALGMDCFQSRNEKEEPNCLIYRLSREDLSLEVFLAKINKYFNFDEGSFKQLLKSINLPSHSSYINAIANYPASEFTLKQDTPPVEPEMSLAEKRQRSVKESGYKYYR